MHRDGAALGHRGVWVVQEVGRHMQDAQRRPHDAGRAPGVSVAEDVVEVQFDRLGDDNLAASPPQHTTWSGEPHHGWSEMCLPGMLAMGLKQSREHPDGLTASVCNHHVDRKRVFKVGLAFSGTMYFHALHKVLWGTLGRCRERSRQRCVFRRVQPHEDP